MDYRPPFQHVMLRKLDIHIQQNVSELLANVHQAQNGPMTLMEDLEL